MSKTHSFIFLVLSVLFIYGGIMKIPYAYTQEIPVSIDVDGMVNAFMDRADKANTNSLAPSAELNNLYKQFIPNGTNRDIVLSALDQYGFTLVKQEIPPNTNPKITERWLAIYTVRTYRFLAIPYGKSQLEISISLAGDQTFGGGGWITSTFL